MLRFREKRIHDSPVSFINDSLKRGLLWRIQDILVIPEEEFQIQEANGNKIRRGWVQNQMPPLSGAAGRRHLNHFPLRGRCLYPKDILPSTPPPERVR